MKWKNIHTGFLLIFLTAGNLIAIGGYKMPGVWGAAPRRGPRGQRPWRGPRGRAPCGVQGQRPWKLYVFHKVIRWNLHNLWCINDHLNDQKWGKKRKIICCGPPQLQVPYSRVYTAHTCIRRTPNFWFKTKKKCLIFLMLLHSWMEFLNICNKNLWWMTVTFGSVWH